VSASEDLGANDRESIVTGLHSLLKLTGYRTLRGLADSIEDGLDGFCWIYGVGRFASEGVIVRIDSRGAELVYPFTIRKLWSTIDDLETESDARNAYEWLADDIEKVEGIRVEVDIDYDCDVSLLKAKHKRHQLDSGVVIQGVPPYPYKLPMSDAKTYDDWEAERFRRNFPGLDVSPHRETDSDIPGDTTLSDLRLMTQT
jgi:hypothetical protein